MTKTRVSLLSLAFCFLMLASCKMDDSTSTIQAWKLKNDTYFSAMKDSTSWQAYNIPASRGGSSFYYKILTQGNPSSVSPVYTDMVTLQYRGKLIDGTVFDQSFSGALPSTDGSGTPDSFLLYQLVNGWIENLIQMKVGETRAVVLPQELGYGSAGASPSILPYSTTVWIIQLIKVN